jgi:predicted nucleic acid-binding protein
MKRLYLDICTLCRPFDDQRFMRIRLETDAYFLIIQHIQRRRYELVVSPAHYAELSDFEDVTEREKVRALLVTHGTARPWDLGAARQRAERLFADGLGPADAAHVSFAEQGADCLITCDDRLWRRARRLKVGVAVVRPVEFCLGEDLR